MIACYLQLHLSIWLKKIKLKVYILDESFEIDWLLPDDFNGICGTLWEIQEHVLILDSTNTLQNIDVLQYIYHELH